MEYHIAALRGNQVPEFIKILKKQKGLDDDIENAIAHYKKRLKSENSLYTAAYTTNHKNPIGYMAMDPILKNAAIIHFLLTPGMRIKKTSYIEIAKSFMATAINTYSLDKLYITITENYKPAIKLAELFGFKKTRYYGHTTRNGKKIKMLIFSIKKGEITVCAGQQHQ